VAARRHGVVSTAPKGSSGSGGRQRFLRGATFTVAPMNPSTAKKLLGPAIAAVAAAGVLTAPFALAGGGGGGGGGGVPPAAQVGTDLAVVLSPTTASPGTQGVFQYANVPGNLSLRVEVKGATAAGAPASGPTQIQLTTKSLDCLTSTTAVIDSMVLDARGEAKFQPATVPPLTGLEKSRTTINVVTSGGANVAQYIPEPCVPFVL